MSENYNEFCKSKNCPEYIEWDFEFDSSGQPYPCTSCKIVGQSYDIDKYPDNCVFIDEIKKVDINP